MPKIQYLDLIKVFPMFFITDRSGSSSQQFASQDRLEPSMKISGFGVIEDPKSKKGFTWMGTRI